MTGIRNYLVKHGEGELEDLIEHERSRLRQDEILNIDNIIERSLHICVLHPLKLHIYNLFVTEYTRLEPLVSHCNGRKSYICMKGNVLLLYTNIAAIKSFQILLRNGHLSYCEFF